MRVRDGTDAEAWRTFVAVYAPVVYRYARRQGLQDADASDLMQEVMGEVSRAIRGFDYRPERGRFRCWLRTIARRKLLRFHERQGRRPEVLVPPEELEQQGGAEADRDWDEAFHAEVLRVALSRVRRHFEPSTWRAFERVWLENTPAAEAAAELSMRIEAVYYTKSRVLKRLEEEVQDLAEEFWWQGAPGVP
jgi:RNA polymerase sigma-70 factor (ECF subfamily)